MNKNMRENEDRTITFNVYLDILILYNFMIQYKVITVVHKYVLRFLGENHQFFMFYMFLLVILQYIAHRRASENSFLEQVEILSCEDLQYWPDFAG